MTGDLPMAAAPVCQLHISEFGRLSQSQEAMFRKLDELVRLVGEQARLCAGQCVKVEQIQDDMAALRTEIGDLKSRVAGLEKLVAEARGAGRAARWSGRLVAGLLGGGAGAALVKFWLSGGA